MINSHWLEVPMSRTKLYGLKDVRAIEARLYNYTFLQFFTVCNLFLFLVQTLNTQYFPGKNEETEW